MPPDCNATRLVLIPKISSPNTTTDFWPIACCNVMYKVISKLLCNRLKKVLPVLINECQGAFVNGQELLFNVLLSQEIARGYTRKYLSPRCMMKIDLRKAYDSVFWEMVREMLDSLNFPTVFTSWVMACVSFLSFTIHMNGGTIRVLKGEGV